MKRLSMILALVAGFFSTTHAQKSADDILGKWTSEDKSRVFEIVKRGNGYDAVIQDAPSKDMIGKNQLEDLVYNDGTYKGKVYLPKKGKSYPCTVVVKSDDTLELTAKAGLISKSQTWKRVQ